MKRIVFTGGSGKAGRHVVSYLVDHGYPVLNVDTRPLDHLQVRTLVADITDPSHPDYFPPDLPAAELSNRRAREVLGVRDHHWREYVDA